MKKTLLTAITLFFLAQIQAVTAAPESDLWPRWQAHDEKSTKKINHELWRDFLAAYLVTAKDGINRIRYADVTSADKKSLNQYLQDLQQTAISQFSRPQQFAYWVNLYNAKTVALVLGHYPVESIKDISFGWFSFGPWDEKLLKVEGQQLSLNDIEHRILRPIWQDNRIHYVVNCASMGCPNLAKVPYTAENQQQLLQDQAIAYVNHPRGVTVEGNTVVASKIYDWYAVDFGNSEKALIDHLIKFAKPELAAKLKALKNPDFEYRYDWRLNQ